jgi:hypothetical protein
LKLDEGRQSGKLRTELVERSNQHFLNRGPMRKKWLRGQENVHKRYLFTVAASNLSILMRKLIGDGTPKGTAKAPWSCLFGILLNTDLYLIFDVSFDESSYSPILIFLFHITI